MFLKRSYIVQLVERGVIPAEKIDDALSVTKITPNGNSWRQFIDNFLLWLGSLALAFSAMFFIAYNWNDMDRLAKFGLIEGFIILAILLYWKLNSQAVVGKVILLIATILLGVLLALYGQTYQTGADPWQLFFNWALLMLPWAIIGRFPAIWIVWAALINLSLILYHQAFRGLLGVMFGSELDMLWQVFVFNSLCLFTWEILTKYWSWLNERWAIRLLAIGSGISITWIVMHSIFEQGYSSILPGLIWIAWLVVLYFVYRKLIRDLFMLAGCCLSVIVVSISFVSKHIFDAGTGSFLVIALMIIGLGAGAAIFLKNIHQEWQT